MIYARNKDGFKKGIAKVEHNDTRQNILNMVKEFIAKDGPNSNRPIITFANQPNENKCKNKVDKVEDEDKFNSAVSIKSAKNPALSQSFYSSIEPRRPKDKLKINQILDISLTSNFGSSASKAQRDYIQLLEGKIEQLEANLVHYKNKFAQMENQYRIDLHQLHQSTDIKKLNSFYNHARNILILQSVELIECKNIMLNDVEKQSRIKSINVVLGKSQQLLEIYRKTNEKNSHSPKKRSEDNSSVELSVSQLRELCQYQQKTIDFLRKQSPLSNQINEVRLLRYEINRVYSENELLREEMQKKKSPAEIGSGKKRAQMQKNESHLKKEIESLNRDLQNLRSELQTFQDLSFKLNEQKQCLASLFNETKSQKDELELKIEGYEKEIHGLKLAHVKALQNSNFYLGNKSVATTEQFCRDLKQFPQYFNLFMDIINQYEEKISKLQDKVCQQRQLKEKYMQWSKQIYQFMKQAQLSNEIVQKHMKNLYEIDSNMNHSKIEKILRQIRALSIGIEQDEIHLIQSQLQEFVLSLKERNRIIQQVDCEDGSSVAISDSFTDQQLE